MRHKNGVIKLNAPVEMVKTMKDKEKNKQLQNKNAEDGQPQKLTIYEYEEKYVKRQNSRGAAALIKIIAVIIGVFLFYCLFSIFWKVYEANLYAGIAVGVVCIILYIFLFIVPLVKILRTDYFQTNVNSKHARAAQKHNRVLRRNISEKIVELNASVDGVGWYSDEVVTRLEYALKQNDDDGIKRELTALYGGSVKSSAHSVIAKGALRSGTLSALSQNSTADAALIAVVNLQMIKDIVFLYGFRPSDARLLKIFARVVQNSLVAYGLGNFKIGNGVVRTIGDAAKGIPLLGSAISVLVDSSVQGLTNAALTAVIGFQTIKYLNKEYRLQDILDGVELPESQEELEKTIEEVETELKKGRKKQKAAV